MLPTRRTLGVYTRPWHYFSGAERGGLDHWHRTVTRDQDACIKSYGFVPREAGAFLIGDPVSTGRIAALVNDVWCSMAQVLL
jgi:hypothetical protein